MAYRAPSRIEHPARAGQSLEEEQVNKVVARFTDGRTIKGTTADFFQARPLFHVSLEGAAAGDKPVEVQMKDLKAVFFVKDLAGDRERAKRNEFEPAAAQAGRRIKVVFADGEVLVGTTTGYQRERPGFFVVPADAGSNIERCYVVAASAKEVSFL
jgi:hypothetical protein